MTKIILTRHGETVWNLERRVQGSLDSPLSENGLFQARRLAIRLRNEGIKYLYASDAPRALATAEEIRKEIELSKILTSQSLREFSFGDWEGKIWEELRLTYPKIFKIWDTEPHLVQVPGGESMKMVSDRAWKFLQDILNRHDGETICIVSHGLTLKLLVTRAMGYEVHEWNKTPWQHNTAVNIWQVENNIITPLVIADCTHLEN